MTYDKCDSYTKALAIILSNENHFFKALKSKQNNFISYLNLYRHFQMSVNRLRFINLMQFAGATNRA